MTQLKALQDEYARYKRIVAIKKRHIKEAKKVLNFYLEEVKKIENKIKELENDRRKR